MRVALSRPAVTAPPFAELACLHVVTDDLAYDAT
jgi:hypothetical protein